MRNQVFDTTDTSLERTVLRNHLRYTENTYTALAVYSVVCTPWTWLEERARSSSNELRQRNEEANRMPITRKTISVDRLGKQESRGSLVFLPYGHGSKPKSVVRDLFQSSKMTKNNKTCVQQPKSCCSFDYSALFYQFL